MQDDRFLTQVIELPTRDNNCLDLICTNTPDKILNTDVILGISDHNIPLVELDVRPVRRRQRPRKIHLYKKAKWDAMERFPDSPEANSDSES